MAYVDPWGGYNEGMRGLGQTFTDLSTQKRQEELGKMAKAEFDAKMQDRARESETRQGLANIYAQGKETTTIPEKSAAEVMNEPGYNLSQELPQPQSAQQVPTYSPQELQAKAAQYMTERGDWAGLKGLESSMDITDKLSERDNKLLTNISSKVAQLKGMGYTDVDIKNDLKKQVENINRMSGKQVFDPNAIDRLIFSQSGNITYLPAPDGSTVAVIKGQDGSIKTLHMPKQKAEKQYLSRTRPEGRVNVFEESQDDGKTWKEISRGEKDRPVQVNTGSNKIDSIVAREAVKDLPKLRTQARIAEASARRLDQMLPLAEKGAAAGLGGNVLAGIGTLFDTQATSEASLFQQMAKMGAGQLRATVIGPGQVSNYENQLLQSIAGGGNAARSATINLLKFYRKEADNTVANYHDALSAADIVTDGKASKGFGKLSKETTTNAKGAPTKGTVVKGYIFLGGNPADKSSWRKK
ncbi:MAG: hypothetical protein JZU65_05675 [Chlorobium sp.]|nr:hypothetical protein [Chlorobium sp.]